MFLSSSSFSLSGAEVREVDLKAVTGGIVHTKLWVVDQKHFYLGSANMDWRSLSQVKPRERCLFMCTRISVRNQKKIHSTQT